MSEAGRGPGLSAAERGATAVAPDAGTPDGAARVGRGVLVAAVLAVLAGVVLRFVAPPALWLDEAQSVAIARGDLDGLFTGLEQDGSPPLYYLLLHGWIGLFGESAGSVRALSGLFGVLALPLAWVLGRRLGGPRVALAFTLLLASSPFAIRYSSETRMYSLLVLLALLAAASVTWAVSRRGPLPVLAVGLSSAALLLTHYWAVYLLVAAGLVTLAALRVDRAAAVRVLAGFVLAGLLFLPWVPTLRYQLAHTGTPWAAVGGLGSITTALDAWRGGVAVLPQVLGLTFVVLAVLAVATRPAADGVRLGLARGRGRWVLVALSLGTLVVAGVASLLTASAVSGRYTSVALPAFLALVAVGIVGLPSRRTAAVVLAGCVLVGLGLAASSARNDRTQAGQVARALQDAAPGDTVVFCPDQLGPSVSRLAPAGLDLVVYPDLRPADRVDWVDYAERNESADPAAVAAELSARAGDGSVWLVTSRGYRVPSDEACEQVGESLEELRGDGGQLLFEPRRGAGEVMRLERFRAPVPAAP
ncbi:glycosyltransferase family 39 protein [Modestobacter sp. VKM Ac-2986]|uniref:glycosyltransferase family 39 protein n=1 Tax=Modestobacter sp. VKM Ac-2986 TaxID=3004140 RepID=UPI0022AB4F94|nr:glycosyltransferase family 39 protein [Modestobacter sp. VKM Ac-2986]MCZ2829542.1 glycosyltransferase family 39 protein [Modestobacter sp. VKM Ac-2986]